jgi:DNA-binding CsgD family transcriptional regulator
MATTETKLLQLALMAYESAAEPALWPRFLELYANAVSSDTAFLQIHDLNLSKSNMLSAYGTALSIKQSYNEYYSKVNVWRERGRSLYVPGTVTLDQEHCPRSTFERSEFYNDYLRQVDLAYSFAAVISRRETQAATLTALRGRRQGEFGEEERTFAKLLLPHLARAWNVCERFELLAAGESVLDSLRVGIVFLGPGGVAVYANQCAEEIFRADDGLSLRDGRLSISDRTADADIRHAIDHALAPHLPPAPRAVVAPRASGRRAYEVVIAPLRTRLRQFIGMAAPLGVGFITDPEQPGPARLDLLMQLYGLTPKEAEIAVKLSEAKTVEQTAEELGMTYHTARTHLRRIFSKTGTSRQTELLLLVARLPGAAQE